METVAESHDPALAEDLIRFIMIMEDKELFAAMLYTCYELVKPDVALEIAWRCGLYEYVMPYFIQFVRDLSLRVDTVQKKTDDIKKKEEKTAEEQINQPLDIDVGFLFPGMMGGAGQGMLSLMPPPGSMPNMSMGGYQYGATNQQFGTGYGGPMGGMGGF
jgi:clathrin heavy chain